MLKSKYNSLAEWKKENPKAYAAAKRMGWIKNIREIFGWVSKKNKNKIQEWTKEECMEDAKQFQTRTKWTKSSPSIAYYAKINNWDEECCLHMIKFSNAKKRWTKEQCIEDALKYKSLKEWRKHQTGYGTALRNGWIKECSVHMTPGKKTPDGTWTKEKCIEDARKYKTIKEWKKKSGGAHAKARAKKWMDECCSHMESYVKTQKIKKTPMYTYTLEVCMNDAKKYSRPIDWERNSNLIYRAAVRNRWLKDCTAHMTRQEGRVHRNYWNEQTIIESTKSFTSITEWRKKFSTAYAVASKMGILVKISSGLKRYNRNKK